MALFKYTAKDKEGNTKKGTLEADSKEKAAQALSSHKLIPITIQEDKKRFSLGFIKKIIGRVSGKDLASFTRQLATMVSAGLPLSQAMQTLELQTDNEVLRKVINDVRGEIESGSSLSSALEKHPKIFDNVYVNLVKVGETSGKLDKVLVNLADAVERSNEFKSNVKSALVYPFLITITMVVVFVFLLTFVVPKLAQIYESFNIDLPLQTRLVIGLSDLFVHKSWLVILVTVVLGYGFKKFKESETGRYFIAKYTLKLPVIGPLQRDVEVTEFTRTLALLISSGVPILQSMEIVTDSMTNVIYREGVELATKQVEKGSSLAVALSSSTTFPPMLTQMISVGEETGKLDEVLYKLSEFLQAQTDVRVKNLSTAIEPVILVALGAMVGFLVISVVLPIYNLTSSF